MARNTGRGARTTQRTAQSQQEANPPQGLWVRRNPPSGKFSQANKTGGAFKGARRAG